MPLFWKSSWGEWCTRRKNGNRKKKSANSCFEKKIMTNKEIPLHSAWLQKGRANQLLGIVEVVKYTTRETCCARQEIQKILHFMNKKFPVVIIQMTCWKNICKQNLNRFENYTWTLYIYKHIYIYLYRERESSVGQRFYSTMFRYIYIYI